MPAKFKINTKVALIHEIKLIDNSTIPIGSKGKIARKGFKIGGNYYYAVNFEAFPEFSPQTVPENYLVKLAPKKDMKEALKKNREFAEWLEEYVTTRIKKEVKEIGRRCMSQGITITKIKKITKLTKTEIKKLNLTDED